MHTDGFGRGKAGEDLVRVFAAARPSREGHRTELETILWIGFEILELLRDHGGPFREDK